MNVSALRSGIYAKPEQSACFRTTEYIKALTEDSETTVSVQKLVGGGVQDTEVVCSTGHENFTVRSASEFVINTRNATAVQDREHLYIIPKFLIVSRRILTKWMS